MSYMSRLNTLLNEGLSREQAIEKLHEQGFRARIPDEPVLLLLAMQEHYLPGSPEQAVLMLAAEAITRLKEAGEGFSLFLSVYQNAVNEYNQSAS